MMILILISRKNDEDAEYFKFLKQYLTLHRAELFFADKAIFIEGDTERVLLPAMMKKIDQEDKNNRDKTLPLLSQNISIIEVGAYSHIFEKFFDFIGLKSLVITDIDATMQVVKTVDGKDKVTYEKCRVEYPDAKYMSNASLKYFFFHNLKELAEDKKLDYFRKLSFENKRLKKDCDSKKWVTSNDGHICIVYQIKEKNLKGEEYCARSFEDAFFHLNRQFIIDNKSKFNSLKNIAYFEDTTKHALHNTTPNISKSIEVTDSNGDRKTVKVRDGEKIQLANSKIDEIRNSFTDWLNGQSPEFKQRLADLYNSKFNCFEEIEEL